MLNKVYACMKCIFHSKYLMSTNVTFKGILRSPHAQELTQNSPLSAECIIFNLINFLDLL